MKKVEDMNKENLNPKREIKKNNAKPPVCLFSDFEGRPDLLILFLIRSGVIVDEQFKTECLNFITPEHQPKDYSDEDFTKLNELVVKLLTMFQTKRGINTNNAVLQFLGDYFGNRPLAGKTSQEKQKTNQDKKEMVEAEIKDDKLPEGKNLIVNCKEKKEEKEEKRIIVKVGSSNDKLPNDKHLMVNGQQNDCQYGSRSNIILCGTNDENVYNYSKIIDLNRHVSNIMLSLIELKNVENYLAGNHDAYGSNINGLATGTPLDRFVFHATDMPNDNPCVGFKGWHEGCLQTFDDLDLIKNEFINGLKTKNKPLQLFNCMKIGDKNFIFKHTNFATEGQFLKMSQLARNPQEVEFLPRSNIRGTDYDNQPIRSWVIKKHCKLKAELVGDKGAGDECIEYGFQDITTMDNLEEEYNCFVCFGHTGQASENEDLTKNNCLCVDCDLYTRQTKEQATEQCNFFKISSDGNKIEEINLYTGEKIREFETFSKTKAQEQKKQEEEKKIKKEKEEMVKQINDLTKKKASLQEAVDNMNAQLFESNNKAKEEQDKLDKIRSYIEYNNEIKNNEIDENSIVGYLTSNNTFKNRGNAFTRQIGFDRRRKARFNALCEVLEEKIRAKTKDNTFTFGDNLDNIAEEKINRIKELFQENGNNQNNEANQEVIYNVRNNINNEGNNLNNTQTINQIKQEIVDRLNQVGCCC